jgi:hypothetical protein
MVDFIDCGAQALTARKRWMTTNYRVFDAEGIRTAGVHD